MNVAYCYMREIIFKTFDHIFALVTRAETHSQMPLPCVHHHKHSNGEDYIKNIEMDQYYIKNTDDEDVEDMIVHRLGLQTRFSFDAIIKIVSMAADQSRIRSMATRHPYKWIYHSGLSSSPTLSVVIPSCHSWILLKAAASSPASFMT